MRLKSGRRASDSLTRPEIFGEHFPDWPRVWSGIVGGGHHNRSMSTAVGSRTSGDARLVACESASRRLDQSMVELVAGLDRDGMFAERGYPRAAHAVADLLGRDVPRAARLVRAAEQVATRTMLDGQVLPARLPATAAALAAGRISVRHVEVISEVLTSAAAARLTPAGWAGGRSSWPSTPAVIGRGSWRCSRRTWSPCWTRTARSPTSGTPCRSTSCT